MPYLKSNTIKNYNEKNLKNCVLYENNHGILYDLYVYKIKKHNNMYLINN